MNEKYLEIEEANKAMVTTDIKGKDYVQVNERIKAFRMVHPLGSITTEIIYLEMGVVTMKATITDENGVVLGTGLAQEKENSSFINKTSFIENCETSAVGRALGMCGFGIDTSVASADEVTNAINNQEPKLATKTDKTTIKKTYGDKLPKLLEGLGLKDLEEMTYDQAKDILKKLEEASQKKAMEDFGKGATKEELERGFY